MTDFIKFPVKSLHASVHYGTSFPLRHKLIIVPFLFAFFLCAHRSPFHTETIFTKIDEVAASLSANRISHSALKDIKMGKSGYYYLMDHEGTVLYHPNPSIEGINFSGIPMVKSILEKKSGCFIHYFDGQEKIVIFRSAEPQGILCFTINVEEVQGAGNHCQRFE